jgi:hypothetical protein
MVATCEQVRCQPLLHANRVYDAMTNSSIVIFAIFSLNSRLLRARCLTLQARLLLYAYEIRTLPSWCILD